MKRILQSPSALFLGLTLLSACSSSSSNGGPNGDLFDGYPSATLDLPVLLPITALTPTSVDMSVTGFSVDPALPAGLQIDSVTGEISGAPTELVAAADYTITATDGNESDTFVINIEVRDPVVAISASRPLIRSNSVTVVTVPQAGTGPLQVQTPPVTGVDAATAANAPNAASESLVNLEDVPGASMSLPSEFFDATQDFQTFIAVIDEELSADSWQLSAQAPYAGLTPTGPSFQWDTSVEPIETNSLTVDYELANPAFGPYSTNSLPTLALERSALTNPFQGSVSPGAWTVLGGVLYGPVADFIGFERLYAFDPAGPSLTQITNNGAGAVNEAPVILGTFGSLLVVSMLDNSTDLERELFLVDPGVSVVQAADTRSGSDNPTEALEYDGALYFTAQDSTGALALYRYTPGAPAMVDRIGTTGAGNGDEPAELTLVGDRLYFTALDSLGVRSLYSFDSGTDTLSRLTDTNNPEPTGLVNAGGELYLACEDSVGGRKFFHYDTTGEALVQLCDFQDDPTLDDSPEDLFFYSDDIFFTALRPVTSVRKLHRFQPMAMPLRAEQITNVAGSTNDDNLEQFTSAGTEVCFIGDNSNGFRKLWSFNDATGEVREIVDLNGPTVSDAPEQLTAFGSKLALVLDTDGSGAKKLFIYDTVTRGIVQVANTTGDTVDDEVQIRGVVGSVLYYTAADGGSGFRLYSIQEQ